GRLSCHWETKAVVPWPSLAGETPGHDAQISTGLLGWSAPVVTSNAYRYWWNVPSASRFVLATTYSVPVVSAITGVLVTPMTGAIFPQASMSSVDMGASPFGTRPLLHS